jgi:hypothetical protein
LRCSELTVKSVPFISLAGGTAGFTDAPGGSFLGGVCLDAYKHDTDRINHLIKILSLSSADQVCLLYNGKNSAFVAPETIIFTYKQNADLDQSNINNAANVYKEAFNNIGTLTDDNGNLPGIEAVVVSADPFFTQTRDKLTTAAGNFPYHVCYPLKEYKSGAKAEHSTIHAPKSSLAALFSKNGTKG